MPANTRRIVIPPYVQRGENITAAAYNDLIRLQHDMAAMLRELTPQSSPDIGHRYGPGGVTSFLKRRGGGGRRGSGGRFQISLSEGTKLHVSPGAVVYYELLRTANESDETDETYRPVYPTLEGEPITADPAPSFDVSDRDSGALWLICRRSRCGQEEEGSEEEHRERIELTARGAKPEIEVDARSVLLCEFDLEGEESKSITNHDRRWESDWPQAYLCPRSDGDSDSDEGSSDSGGGGSSDKSESDSSGPNPDPSSEDGSSDDPDPSDSDDDDDDDPDPDCELVMDVLVTQLHEKPSCKDCPPEPGAPPPYVIGYEIEITPGDFCDVCSNIWAKIWVDDFILTDFTSSNAGEYIVPIGQPSNVGWLPVTCGGLSSIVTCWFRQNSMTPCTDHKLHVQIKSSPEDSDECCGNLFNDALPFKNPPCCSKGGCPGSSSSSSDASSE